MSRLTTIFQRSAEDIDVWTRSFAEEHARRAGISVRDWLNQFAAENMTQTDGGSPECKLQPDAPLAQHDNPEIAAPPEEPDFVGAVDGWRPPRDSFGQRTGPPVSPEPIAVAAPTCAARDLHDEPAALRVRVGAASDRTRLARRLADGEIEHLLDDPSALAQAGAEDAERLNSIVNALREVRAQAAEQGVHGAERIERSLVETTQPASSTLGQASAEAIAQLGVDIARLFEVVDCGFERIEAVSALHAAELRDEIGQKFDKFAPRLAGIERQSLDRAAEAAPEPSLAPAASDVDQPDEAPQAAEEADSLSAPAACAHDPDGCEPGAGAELEAIAGSAPAETPDAGAEASHDAWPPVGQSAPPAAADIAAADDGRLSYDPAAKADAQLALVRSLYDPDSDLFDKPPALADEAAHVPLGAAASDDSLIWAPSTPLDRDLGGAGGDARPGWPSPEPEWRDFGSGRLTATDWPDEESDLGFGRRGQPADASPADASAADDADATDQAVEAAPPAPPAGAKGSIFSWLARRAAGTARKRA